MYFSVHFEMRCNHIEIQSDSRYSYLLASCTLHWDLIHRSFAVADPGFSPGGVRQLPKVLLFFNFFPENCMKMKEFGPPDPGFSPRGWGGGGVRQLPKVLLFFNFFPENCMKMKEFGPPGGYIIFGLNSITSCLIEMHLSN